MKLCQAGLLQGGLHSVTVAFLEVSGFRRKTGCGLLPLHINRVAAASVGGFLLFGAIAAVARKGARRRFGAKATEMSARNKTKQGRHAKENGKQKENACPVPLFTTDTKNIPIVQK